MTDIGRTPIGLTPHLVCKAGATTNVYKAALDSTDMLRLPGDDGQLLHASLITNDELVTLVAEFPVTGSKSPQTIGNPSVTVAAFEGDPA